MDNSAFEKLSQKNLRHFDRYIDKLYLSPKFRKAQTRFIARSLSKIQKDWPHLNDMEEDKSALVETMATYFARIQQIIREAKEWSDGRILRKKKFRLFQHIFRKNEYMVLFDFYKVSLEIQKQGTIIFPNGLPSKNVTVQALFYKNGYSDKGYTCIDSGTFYQRLINRKHGIYTLKGKQKILRFHIYMDDKIEHQATITLVTKGQTVSR